MGWGSSTGGGGGRKIRALPRKFVFLGSRREESGMSRDFGRDVPDPWQCPKSLCQKKFVRIFRSLRKNIALKQLVSEKITHLARNSLKMSFFPGHFKITKSKHQLFPE